MKKVDYGKMTDEELIDILVEAGAVRLTEEERKEREARPIGKSIGNGRGKTIEIRI